MRSKKQLIENIDEVDLSLYDIKEIKPGRYKTQIPSRYENDLKALDLEYYYHSDAEVGPSSEDMKYLDIYFNKDNLEDIIKLKDKAFIDYYNKYNNKKESKELNNLIKIGDRVKIVNSNDLHNNKKGEVTYKDDEIITVKLDNGRSFNYDYNQVIKESKELRKYNSRLYGIYDTEKEKYVKTGTLEEMRQEVEVEKEDIEEPKEQEEEKESRDININVTIKNENIVKNYLNKKKLYCEKLGFYDVVKIGDKLSDGIHEITITDITIKGTSNLLVTMNCHIKGPEKEFDTHFIDNDILRLFNEEDIVKVTTSINENKKEDVKMKNSKKESKEKNYTITIGYYGYMEIEKEYEVVATSKDEAIEYALEEAKQDLEVEDIEQEDENTYTVCVSFATYIEAEESFSVNAEDESEAEDLALEEASYELEVLYINGIEVDEFEDILDENKQIKTEEMNGFDSTNSRANQLFDDFKEFEDIDFKEWNRATKEERENIVRPFVVEFYKQNREKIDDNWEDFMELLEYWNYHTEYRIFDHINDYLEESKKLEVKKTGEIYPKYIFTEDDRNYIQNLVGDNIEVSLDEDRKNIELKLKLTGYMKSGHVYFKDELYTKIQEYLNQQNPEYELRTNNTGNTLWVNSFNTSKKEEVKFKDKVKAIKKSLKKNDKRLSDETAEDQAKKIAGSMIKNEDKKGRKLSFEEYKDIYDPYCNLSDEELKQMYELDKDNLYTDEEIEAIEKEIKDEFNNIEESKKIKTESLSEESINPIINPEDRFYKDEHLFRILVYPGAGVEMIPYYVYANYEQDALEILVPYLKENAPGLLIDITDLEDEDLDDYITIDGIYYLDYNTRIEELFDKEKEKIETEFFKNYKEED